MHFNVCPFSPLTFKIVLMTWMLALIKVYFSLLYAEWRIWMSKSVLIECWLKCKNRNWIWFMRKCSYFRANKCTLALLVAVSRKWLRIFSWWTAKGVLQSATKQRIPSNVEVHEIHSAKSALSIKLKYENYVIVNILAKL